MAELYATGICSWHQVDKRTVENRIIPHTEGPIWEFEPRKATVEGKWGKFLANIYQRVPNVHKQWLGIDIDTDRCDFFFFLHFWSRDTHTSGGDSSISTWITQSTGAPLKSNHVSLGDLTMVTCVRWMHTKYLSSAQPMFSFYPPSSVMFVFRGACPEHITASFHNTQRFRVVSLLVFL